MGGGLFAGVGALGKHMAASMYSGMTGLTGPFPGVYDSIAELEKQMAANDPLHIMCNAIMIFGLVLMAAGIILAIWLKKKSR